MIKVGAIDVVYDVFSSFPFFSWLKSSFSDLYNQGPPLRQQKIYLLLIDGKAKKRPSNKTLFWMHAILF